MTNFSVRKQTRSNETKIYSNIYHLANNELKDLFSYSLISWSIERKHNLQRRFSKHSLIHRFSDQVFSVSFLTVNVFKR